MKLPHLGAENRFLLDGSRYFKADIFPVISYDPHHVAGGNYSSTIRMSLHTLPELDLYSNVRVLYNL